MVTVTEQGLDMVNTVRLEGGGDNVAYVMDMADAQKEAIRRWMVKH